MKSLATLPSLDELRAKLLGFYRPRLPYRRVLQAPGGQIARVLDAYAKKAGRA